MGPDQCGSHSSDLGGAARIAPLVFFYQNDRPGLLAAVRQQTAMTHNHPATLAGAEFLAKTGWEVLNWSRFLLTGKYIRSIQHKQTPFHSPQQ